MELKQEDHEFEANLCYTTKPCLTFLFFKVHYVYADSEVQNHQDLPTVTQTKNYAGRDFNYIGHKILNFFT